MSEAAWGSDGPAHGGSVGQSLLAGRLSLDGGEAAWLADLAVFDRTREWADWGHLSCIGWLVSVCRMARATAFEKVRVARQLFRRPQVAAALADRRISYSAARAITRAEDPDPDVDAALIQVAVAGTVADVERAVRTYQAYADQERPLRERIKAKRGARITSTGDGLVHLDVYLTELEGEELRSALARRMIADDRPRPSGDQPCGDESSAADSVDPWTAERVAGQRYAARLADALVDLIRAADHLGQTDEGGSGADRYCTHVVVTETGPATLLDGTPIPAAEAERIGCDTSRVDHHYSAAGEPLYLGRRVRAWTSAQQRAARVRDGGQCRFPGCGRRVADLHHLQWWEQGGPTDISNGLLLCTRHHTLVHERRFTITGNPNHRLSFHTPDRRLIGTTGPRSRDPVSVG